MDKESDRETTATGQDQDIAIKPKKKRSVQSKKRDREAKCIELHAKGVPVRAIADTLEISQSRVTQILKTFAPVFETLGNIDELKATKNRLLEASEFTLLKSMLTEDKLAKAGVNQLAFALREVSVLRRLEAGLSTANVAQSVTHTRKQ